MIYSQLSGFEGGSRFYLSYSGSAPSPANCVTLATDIGTAFGTELKGLINVNWTLAKVDVLDLATSSGASGEATPGIACTRSGAALPANIATDIEYNIARRYRGGKPRMYLPGPVQGDQTNESEWAGSFVSAVNTDIAAFFANLEALSIGSMGTLQHVNVSFYHGVYTTTPPWRGPGYKYPPKYRDTVVVDAIEGYDTKSLIGTQKRRRQATTP
jgi:hypothetical protein